MPRPRDSFDLMANVARMYYLDKMSQGDIGRFVGLSTSQVSRLIKRAWENGIVQVKIVRRPDKRLEETAAALKATFGLKEVSLVSSEGTSAFITLSLIAEAGHLLERCLLSDELKGRSPVLGISWGTTLSRFAEHYRPSSAIPETLVVPMVGGVGQASADLQVNHIAGRVAEELGGKCLQLFVPSLVDSAETARHLLSENSVREVTDHWDFLTCALVGIGSPDSVASTGYAGDLEFYETVRRMSCGDVCVNFFDHEGRPALPESHARTISCQPDQLRRVPFCIGLAVGPHKVRPILGAIRSGMINCLATDLATAEAVLETQGRLQEAGES